MNTCQCGRRAIARGLCPACYQRAKYHGELAFLDPATRKCEQCGQPLAGRTSPKARFCSRRCVEAARTARRRERVQAARTDRICAECGTSIPVEVTGRAKFCSPSCLLKWQNRQKAVEKHAGVMARRTEREPCALCGGPIPQELRNSAIYCSAECRKKVNAAIWRERASGYNRQYKYGLNPEQFAAMLASQGGVCAICRTDTWERGKGNQPHVDHDPATGKIRGILCGGCNNGLGNFDHDPARLRAAADYLEKTC